MKLLFVHDHPFYKENLTVYSGGGLPKIVWNNYLLNFEEVTVYGRYSDNLKDKKVVSSVDNVVFKLTNKYNSVLSFMKNKNLIEKELDSLIEGADVVLARLPSILGFMAASIALRKKKILWVEQVGNANEAFGSHGSIIGKFAAPILEYIDKKIVHKADFVSYVTVSKLQKDYPYNSKAEVVSLSNVIINKILLPEELQDCRFNEKVVRVGVIGGFDAKYKGQDVLLKAISLLDPNIRDDFKVSFVGKGDYGWVNTIAEDLNVKNNIEFIGALEAGNQVNRFLKNLSLYVQPSLTEGMPRATIEAMAMGCPVIGSNAGGIPDVISKKFIHIKGDYKKLAKHLEYLYFNRQILSNEALLSLNKAVPYKKENLDKKRMDFYSRMNEIMKNDLKNY